MGDCCDDSNYEFSRSTCTECFCHVEIPQVLETVPCLNIILNNIWSDLGNGVCNPEFNNIANLFDAGDCCYDPDTKENQCFDSNIICHNDTLGDGLCQDYNNGPLCDYDMGDCCLPPFEMVKNECCYCKCHAAVNYDFWIDLEVGRK